MIPLEAPMNKRSIHNLLRSANVRASREMIKQRSGFTLLELLVTIGILSIIAAASIPSYAAAQRRLIVNQTSAELAEVLETARTKAMASGADILVTISAASLTQKNLATGTITTWAPPSGITLSAASLTFTRLTGLATNATITVQNSQGNTRSVAIASNGKVSLP